MHSRLLAVLPYLRYGQALLCCHDSPAQCTAACSLSCLICVMDRLFYAVMTHLLTCTAAVQYLLHTVQLSPARCPFSLCFPFRLFCYLSCLTCSLLSCCLVSAAHCPDTPAAILPLLLSVLSHLLTAQLLFSLCCSLSRHSCCYPASSASCPVSPAHCSAAV